MVQQVFWCSGCSAEQAVEVLHIEWDGEMVSFPVGEDCLTRASENGMIMED